ncbi:hypothetical protein BWK57_11775 [Flavobacterium columnare]|uniref:VirB4 family type IV secretion system protein n=1 Tax=Flavobacterium columnare TaxID=996 RepID=UPI000CDA3D86|nr:DUF87 domain-containing protein [Flavobacterium columnare]POR20965.1 hypothetical protein BWK57_11775 [Flavobacterium columnare]
MNELKKLKSKLIYSVDNEVVFLNGVYLLGYELILPEKYSLGKEDYETLNENWNKALKDLPTGTVFYKQDVFLKKPIDTTFYPNDNFLQTATKEYFSKFEFMDNKCYLFFMNPSLKIISKNLINPFLKLTKKEFQIFDSECNNLKTSVLETVDFLNSLKLQGGNRLKITPLSNDFLENYYDTYFNLFEENTVSDRFFENDYIKVGDKYAGMVAILDETKFPDALHNTIKDNEFSNDKSLFFKNYGENLSFNLDFTHVYNQILFVRDTRKELDILRKANDQLHKSSGFDKQNQQFALETDDIIKDIVSNLDTIKLIRGHNNIIVFGENPEKLNSNIIKTAEKLREIDVVKPYVPKGNYLNALFNYSFPLFSQYFTEKQLYLTSLEVFCSFINNTGNYHNDNKGIMYNSRLSNTPVFVDTWDEDKKNINARNFMILAPTGFGKSFNANHIITHYYLSGYKNVIIDLGGSYKKLSSLFPNDISYITYESGKSLGINPFDIEELNTDILKDLVEFISVHYKRDSAISEVEKTSLRKIIEKYYEANPLEASLPDFVEWVKRKISYIEEDMGISKEFFNSNEFLHLMSEFTNGGTYSFLYNSKEKLIGSNLKDKKIIVFELDKAREDKLLLTVMLQLVFSTINKVIWVDKSTRGIVLFDEVAEQLQWDGILRRIQFFYQAIRKQNGSVGIILQSEAQLPDSPLSKSIVENTQILYVLNAKDYRSLQKRFGLSEHAYYQLCSIQSNFSAERPYSEIFIMRGNKHQIYRLEVPKKVWWAFQTEGEKNEKLMQLAEKVGIEKAIDQFIN